MRTRNEAIAACLQFPDAFEDYPFHDPNWTVMRHKTNQKTFAFIFEREGNIWISVKAEPQWGDFWKDAFPAVVPAYHLNKKHWISTILNGSMADEQILPLIQDSYELTQGGRKSQQKTEK